MTAEIEPLISPDRMGSGPGGLAGRDQDPADDQPAVPGLRPDEPVRQRRGQRSDADANISVSGKNNRYNTIQIDGAVNNDLFGLAATGTPGGQTNTQPISLDTIQEIQVAVSPYDIKQGGFTGGAINAITRSGTNDFHGSVYGSTRDENYVGSKVPQAYGDALDKPIATFNSDQYGARVGGPILKDKLFFFASGERNKLSAADRRVRRRLDEQLYKQPGQAAAFKSVLTNKYGYDPGGLGDYNPRTNSDLLLGKLDFNVTSAHQLTFRYNYVDALSDINGDPQLQRLHASRRPGTRSPTRRTRGCCRSTASSAPIRSTRAASATRRSGTAAQVPVAFPSVYICNSAQLVLHREQHVPAARRDRALLRGELAQPGHPRGHRRLHAHQGEPHDHDRDPQRVLQVREPLHPGRLRDVLLQQRRRPSTPGPRPGTRSSSPTGPTRAGRPSSAPSSGASTWATSGGSTTASR